MRRLLLAALVAFSALAIVAAPDARAQALTCVMTAAPQGGAFTLSCAPQGTPTMPAPPTSPVEPPPEPPKAGPCERATDPKFQRAIAERPLPDLLTIRTWRLQRALTADETACARELGVPGAAPPATQPSGGQPADPGVTTGFSLDTKHQPRRNYLQAGVTYTFTAPTVAGERVTVIVLEMVGTPDTMTTRSSVLAPDGRVLSGPTDFARHGSHTIASSPGGTLTLQLTPSVSGWLAVQRN